MNELVYESLVEEEKAIVLIIGPYSREDGSLYAYQRLVDQYKILDHTAQFAYQLYGNKGNVVLGTSDIRGLRIKAVIVHLPEMVSTDMLENLFLIANKKIPGLLIVQKDLKIAEKLVEFLETLKMVTFEQEVTEVVQDVYRLSRDYLFYTGIDTSEVGNVMKPYQKEIVKSL